MSKLPLGKQLMAGAAAGLAGSVAMNVVSYLWSRLDGDDRGQQIVQQGTRPDVAAAQKSRSSEQDLATAETAHRVASPLLGRELSPEERETGGKLVHYAYGAGAGAAYALGVEKLRVQNAGVPFGLLVWAGSILVALPLLRLTASPKSYTAREHALGIAGHIAYGSVLGITYKQLRSRL